MGLRDLLGGNGHTKGFGHLITDVTLEYAPCGEACTKCPDGLCTKGTGHDAAQGHRSNRGANKVLQQDGCGHTW